MFVLCVFLINIIVCKVRVITKLPSNLPKGKAKLISQQPENRNGPDLVQAFPKKWWVTLCTGIEWNILPKILNYCFAK
jgi:hypothetical protein